MQGSMEACQAKGWRRLRTEPAMKGFEGLCGGVKPSLACVIHPNEPQVDTQSLSGSVAIPISVNLTRAIRFVDT